MKKILLFAVMAMVLCGCNKDGDSLNGTTWEYLEDIGFAKSEAIISFQKSTFTATMKEWQYTGGEYVLRYDISDAGTYIYDPPNVILTENGNTTSATISGNKMTINNADGFVYVKK